MKTPVSPPDIHALFSTITEEGFETLQRILENASPVDEKGQELWDEFTTYKNQMFSRTHNHFSPWVVIKSNNKKQARLESIKYVLSLFDYENKGEIGKNLLPDPNIVQRYFRNTIQLDQ